MTILYLVQDIGRVSLDLVLISDSFLDLEIGETLNLVRKITEIHVISYYFIP